MKTSLVHVLLISSFFFSLSIGESQSSDSCASKLTVARLIPVINTTFLSCLTPLRSANFVLRYAKAGPGIWSFVLSAADPKSYVAVGFSGDGRMVGSSAIAGWITGSGAGIAKQYSLGGKKSSGCPPDQGDLLLQGTPVVALQSSRLYLAFQLNVDQPPPYLIFAVGPDNGFPSSPTFLLPEHRDENSISVNYTALGVATSDSGGGEEEEGGEGAFGAERKHALLVMLGWGVLMPIGIVVARYFKNWDPLWFYSHLSIQGLGFGLGLAGVILGFGLDDDGISGVGVHEGLGIAILVGGCLQVTALLARPGKASKVRKYWNWYHHYVGRAAVVCAVANVFYGFKIAEETKSWNIGYGVFVAVWGFIAIFLELRRCASEE
ncbi:hypothetical protein C4D60_Mb06t13110 [Musa balbisiana]|uniref:Cytochrome b561 and DOMON domain-containing protein n=1 Tax=Musa balbisiana TaxID=52838 RepID=A0A4S8IMN7_MUSBA|nr:hypothetical protein C4D60_Mb06t13110 [Musa balbisiana]